MYSDPLYLDYASSTPIDPEVQQAMIDTMAKTFANPSAVHSDGVSSARIISEARQQIATLIEVKPQEIIFTGSGTESINLAFKGLIEVSQIANPHIITSSIEHSATQETCRYLEKKGVEVTYISPDENGLIDPDLINQNIKPGTVLVSIMYVNNELGTIQPLRQISHQITEHNHHRDQPVVFHTDASQAPIFLPISVQSIGVDMLTLDGSKIYGPRGIGVLVKKNYVSLEPIIHGGGQEFNLRSGTENTPAIVGMSLALKKAVTERHQITVKLTKLKERLRQGLLQSIKNISENTPLKQRYQVYLIFVFLVSRQSFI